MRADWQPGCSLEHVLGVCLLLQKRTCVLLRAGKRCTEQQVLVELLGQPERCCDAQKALEKRGVVHAYGGLEALKEIYILSTAQLYISTIRRLMVIPPNKSHIIELL